MSVVYLYPEEEYLGEELEWCKVKVMQGDLVATDVYVERELLRPIDGTNHSINAVIPPEKEPKAYVPDWTNRGPCGPFYNARTGMYCATVVTEHTTYTDTEKETIMQDAKAVGLAQILEYYARRPVGTHETLNLDDSSDAAQYLIDNSYHCVKSEKINLDVRPNAKVKVLVTMPAMYLHAIPRRMPDVSANSPSQCTKTVLLNTHNMQKQFDTVTSTIKNLQNKITMFRGQIKDYLPEKEANRLAKVPSALKELLRSNGFELRKDHEDMIEIACDCDFKPIQVTIYQGGVGTVLDIGFNAFKTSSGINSQRTMHTVIQLHNIHSFIKSQKFKTTPFNWMDFLTKFTYPALDIRFTSAISAGNNLAALKADAAAAIDKFNKMPFKGPEQLKFESGMLNDPEFLKKMMMARMDVKSPSGCSAHGVEWHTWLPELLGEIGSLDDLFGNFLNKVDIPKLLMSAMEGLMDQLDFPDLFAALLETILSQLSLEVILDQIISNLEPDIQKIIFKHVFESLDFNGIAFSQLLTNLGITIEQLNGLGIELPIPSVSLETTETVEIETGDDCNPGPTLTSTIETEHELSLSALEGLAMTDIIDVLVDMVVDGIGQVDFDASSLDLGVDIDGVEFDPSGLTGGSLSVSPGSLQFAPAISGIKIKMAAFDICVDLLDAKMSDIPKLIIEIVLEQLNLGAIDIDFLRGLPVISASFDLMLGDPNLNLNMNIPSLPDISLEMPSINLDMPDISIPSFKIPTITLPDNIPTFDLMGMVFDAMMMSVKAAIESALIAMAKAMIEMLIPNCSGEDSNDLSFGENNIEDLLASSLGTFGAASEVIDSVLPDTADDSEIVEALNSSCGASATADSLVTGTASAFLGDLSQQLTAPEVKSLLEGRPTPKTCEAVQRLVAEGYNNFAVMFENCSQVEEKFEKLGESINPALINNTLPQKRKIANKLDHLCGVLEDDKGGYIQDMKNKGLSDNEIEEQLQAEKDRKKEALRDLANILADLQTDSVLDGIIPPIYPEECGGPSLMPPDSEIPSMNMANEMAVDAQFAGIEMTWAAETSVYFNNMMTTEDAGDVVPLIYPDGSRPEINPMFTMMYSQGYPLCDENGNVYTDEDDIAAAKQIINTKNPAKRPERALLAAFKGTSDFESDYDGVFERPADAFYNWIMVPTESPFAYEEEEQWPYGTGWVGNNDSAPLYFTSVYHREQIQKKVNVLNAKLSASVNGHITGSYQTLYDQVSREGMPTTGEDPWPIVIKIGGKEASTGYIDSVASVSLEMPYYESEAQLSGSDTVVKIESDSSCVNNVEIACSSCLTGSSAPTADQFYSGVPKQAQVFARMAHAAYLEKFPEMAGIDVFEYGGSYPVFLGTTEGVEVGKEAIAGHYHGMWIEYIMKYMAYEVTRPFNDLMVQEKLEALKIEPDPGSCANPTTVLNPDQAKKDAMDAINGACELRNPRIQAEKGKTPLRSGTMVGLIGMTIRAYIADIMLRGINVLKAIPLGKPSALMTSYIYEDMISDMQNIESDYYVNFVAEAVRAYNERSDAEANLSEQQIMHKLIEEQFVIVTPALQQNLECAYTDIDMWFIESWAKRGISSTNLTNTYGSKGYNIEYDMGADVPTEISVNIDFSTGAYGMDGYLTYTPEGNNVSGPFDTDVKLEFVKIEDDSVSSKEELFRKLIDTEQYQNLFHYSIPISDLACLVHLYIAMSVTVHSPEVQTAFDGTKLALKDSFDILFYGDQQGVELTVGSNIEEMNAAQDNTGTDPSRFSDGTSMSKLMAKMAADTVPTMIKGLAEKLDPNIKASKLVRDAALENGKVIAPIPASLALMPMNIIPPIFGGFGAPITPLGLMYWALARPDKIEKRKAAEAGGTASNTSSESADQQISAEECNTNDNE